jgi:hypothetical protein
MHSTTIRRAALIVAMTISAALTAACSQNDAAQSADCKDT